MEIFWLHAVLIERLRRSHPLHGATRKCSFSGPCVGQSPSVEINHISLSSETLLPPFQE